MILTFQVGGPGSSPGGRIFIIIFNVKKTFESKRKNFDFQSKNILNKETAMEIFYRRFMKDSFYLQEEKFVLEKDII